MKFTFTILFFYVVFNSSAQDIHFSQYYASPLTLNPANTGNYDGDWRIMNSYRTQWKVISIPYTTNALAYDRQFYLYSEKLSGGIVYIYDNSGAVGLTANKLYLSGAYHKAFQGHNIHAGIQIGYVRKSYNLSKVTFPSQFTWSSGSFDSGLPNDEPYLNNKLQYADLNFGAAWHKKFNGITPKGGIAFYHINYPNESFFSSEKNHLPVRWVIHAEADIMFTEELYAEPHVLYMNHTKAFNFVPGVNFGIRPSKNDSGIKSVYAGIFYRGGFEESDAAVIVTGINYNRLNVGLSYDINTSQLDVLTKGKGSFEVSLTYTSRSTLPDKVAVPCDIY